jgi:hypothetical protein
MDIGVVFLLLGLMLAVGTYLFAPFIGRGVRSPAAEEHELSALLAERDRLINALQELDFDHRLGKIPDEDYPIQRSELLHRGAGVLQKLDALRPNPSPAGQARARLERAAAAGGADATARDAPPSDDEIESMLAARRKSRGERSAGFCPRCGKPVLVSDRFCPNCGKSLK